MSIEEKGINVTILQREFRVACPKKQERALREAAAYLDRKMRQIRQTGRVVGMERIALMAALNITNELLALRYACQAELEAQFSEPIERLIQKLESAVLTASLDPDKLPEEPLDKLSESGTVG